MRNAVFALAILSTAMAAGIETAQAESSPIARLVFFEARPGTKTQIEDAIRQQIDWRREQKESWRWLTWEYTSGEVPRYCIGTFGHSWSEFDQVSATGRAEDLGSGAVANLASKPPTVQYFEHLVEVSDAGPPAGRPTLAEISVFQLHYGKTARFYAALREAHRAVSRAGGGTRYEWFELRSGGETPQFLLLVPRENWGALDTDPGLFFKNLETHLGKKKATRVFEQFTSAVKSHQRWVVRLRADLSLLPELAGTESRGDGLETTRRNEVVANGSRHREVSGGPALRETFVRADHDAVAVPSGELAPAPASATGEAPVGRQAPR